MAVRLPGLSCEDRFARDLARTLGGQPVHLVAVAPGWAAEAGLAQLADCVRVIGGPALEVSRTLRGADGRAAVLRAVAEAFGWTCPDLLDIESLALANAETLTWPRVLIITVRGPTSGTELREILEVATDLAATTKNAGGPISCLVLTLPGVELAGGRPLDIWGPLHPWPESLPFWRPSASLRNAGFDIYLSLRVYWEAAGQGEFIAALESVFGRAAELAIAPDADERIDRAFDAAMDGRDAPELQWADLFDTAFDSAAARGVLKTGVVLRSRIPVWRLLTAGLAWSPPGSPRALITPLAARHLVACEEFTRRHRLTTSGRVAFRRAVRHNHLIASWVLTLATHVERELVAICQQDPALEQKLERWGLRQKLVEERERLPRGLAYDAKEDLIEYASFRDLQVLVTESELARHAPASSTMLNHVRHVRNLCAHLHPVTWQGVRSVLSVLERVSSDVA